MRTTKKLVTPSHTKHINNFLLLNNAGAAGYSVFQSTPTSFIITNGHNDYEFSQFLARYREISRSLYSREAIPMKHCTENYWLIKPANLNQGRGIEFFKNLKDILHFLSQKPLNTHWVAQKYLERPLLYGQRKFDIRVWVLFTCKNEVFFYKRGYMRTSSDDYSLSKSNNYVHLTNNCLQKHGENYGKHEEGNTIGFEVLQEYLQSKHPSLEVELTQHFLQRMKDLIIDTYLCSRSKMNPNKRRNVFELFGYDFLIDEDLRTWLIEVSSTTNEQSNDS
jgi:hypothetical protein